jgi:16S rRNA (guanine1207-N2)-methyltransferase
VGKSALHDILRTWMQRLSPTGRAYLVVSKNLGADSLSDWLTTKGYPTTKLASSKGFRVLEVRRAV